MSSDVVWIRTVPNPQGTDYYVVVEHDDDHAVTLNRACANRYAAAVLEVVAHAEYDAAVARQLTRLGTDRRDVAKTVGELRNTRELRDRIGTWPLVLHPGVNFEQQPFLRVEIDGKTVGQWSPHDARGHALGVLEALAVADLDQGYLEYLTGTVGLDEPTARATVAGLVDERGASS